MKLSFSYNSKSLPPCSGPVNLMGRMVFNSPIYTGSSPTLTGVRPSYPPLRMNPRYSKFKRRESGSQQAQILDALRQLTLERAPPGTHVHHTLQLWHDGISLNNPTLITHSGQYL